MRGALFVFSPQKPASTGRWNSPRACLCRHRPTRGEGHIAWEGSQVGMCTGHRLDLALVTRLSWLWGYFALAQGPPGVTSRWASPSGSAAKLCASGPTPSQGQALMALSSLSVRCYPTGQSAHDVAVPGNSASPAFSRQWPLRQEPSQGWRLRATTRRRRHISDTSLHAGFVTPFLKALIFPCHFIHSLIF